MNAAPDLWAEALANLDAAVWVTRRERAADAEAKRAYHDIQRRASARAYQRAYGAQRRAQREWARWAVVWTAQAISDAATSAAARFIEATCVRLNVAAIVYRMEHQH